MTAVAFVAAFDNFNKFLSYPPENENEMHKSLESFDEIRNSR